MAKLRSRGEAETEGKTARRRTPRSAHASPNGGGKRPSPVTVLKAQDKTRVKELVPIRHGRMLESAFTFYRGAAAIMAADLAACQRTDLTVQLCGDAHLSNFGIFAAPDRRLVFDINDFDETFPGPFEWDVKRLAASFAIAGRALGFSSEQRRSAVTEATAQYRNQMRALASMRTLDVWYQRLDLELLEEYRSQVSRKQAKQYDREIAKAERKDRYRAFAKLTHRVDGEIRIISDPPLIEPIEQVFEGVEGSEVEKGLLKLLATYRRSLDADVRHLVERYHYVHAARKVVGVGSVGTRAWIVLLMGRDLREPLFLQVKEADRSVLDGIAGRSRVKHQGRRVVEGQRLMQAASDIFLGWLTAEAPDGASLDFYVRQLWDSKGSVEIARMTPATLGRYARLCGWTLARAHARSGDRIAIASYLGKGDRFDRAMAEFAEAYADQNESDFREFAKAVADGRLKANTGL